MLQRRRTTEMNEGQNVMMTMTSSTPYLIVATGVCPGRGVLQLLCALFGGHTPLSTALVSVQLQHKQVSHIGDRDDLTSNVTRCHLTEPYV